MTPEPFETFAHAGMTCELYPDYEPMSPAEWDTLGTLAGFYRTRRDYGGFGEDPYGAEEAYDRRESTEMMLRYLRWQGVAAIPVYFADYGSSGTHLYESDAPNGYLYTTRKRADELGVRWDDVPDALHSEVRTWDAYFAGEVVGYVVRDPAGDVVDSVWGFSPDGSRDPYEYVRAEARATAEHETAERERAARMDIATRRAES